MEAIAVADPLGMRPLIAHCQSGLGELHLRAGQPEAARAELANAADLFRSMRHEFLGGARGGVRWPRSKRPRVPCTAGLFPTSCFHLPSALADGEVNSGASHA